MCMRSNARRDRSELPNAGMFTDMIRPARCALARPRVRRAYLGGRRDVDKNIGVCVVLGGLLQ